MKCKECQQERPNRLEDFPPGTFVEYAAKCLGSKPPTQGIVVQQYIRRLFNAEWSRIIGEVSYVGFDGHAYSASLDNLRIIQKGDIR